MIKKTLLFSVLLLAMVGTAMAADIPFFYTSIQVNPGGRGDVLLGALYDVRDIDGHPQQTFINIVNSDPLYGVVVKLRFREYKRSIEVLDIHIPLSANDVWSGVVYKDPVSGRAYLFSADYNTIDITFASAAAWPLRHDTSSVYLLQPASVTGPYLGRGVPFGITAMKDDETILGLTDTENIARTTYGHLEVIAEERTEDWSVQLSSSATRIAAPGSCGSWAVYDPTGDPAPLYRDAPDFLFGEAWIVSVSDGSAFEYKLDAISNFSVNTCGIAEGVGDVGPTLVNSGQGMVDSKIGGLQPGFGGSEQLEFVLSKRNILAQWVDDPAVLAQTSIVVTFPTKWFHYTSGDGYPINLKAGDGGTPFTGTVMTIQDSTGPTLYTDQFGFTIYDRDEDVLTPTPNQPIISPVPPGQSFTPRWPFEVNIVSLYDDSMDLQTRPPHSVIDGSIDGVAIGRDNYVLLTFLLDAFGQRIPTQDFKAGWILFDLAAGTQGDTNGGPNLVGENNAGAYNFFFVPSSAANFASYAGLPTIGFVMTQYVNGAISAPGDDEGISGFPPYYYNGTIPWAYAVDWNGP